ncbi:hypothetical protein JCM10213v2_008875 [Rhodosporidiobolus nylandii]
MASPSTSLPSNGGGGAFRTDKKALLAALAEELKREKLRAEQAAQRMVEVESQTALDLGSAASGIDHLPPLSTGDQAPRALRTLRGRDSHLTPEQRLAPLTPFPLPCASSTELEGSRVSSNGLAAARAGAVPKGERLANQPHDQTISDAADHHQHFMTKDDVDKVCDRYLQEDPSLKEWEKEVAQRHLWQRERRAQDLEDEQHHFNLMMQDLMTQAEDGDSSNSAPSQRMNALGKHRALSHGELYGSGRRAAIYGRLPTTTAAAFQRW